MKKKRMTLRQKRAITGLLFISPWIIGFAVYYVRSLVMTAQFSFSKIDFLETGGYTAHFIGWDNYVNMFTELSSYNRTFNQILVASLQNILIDVPFVTFFSLFIAILLNSKFKGRTAVRAIFFLPILMGSGAIFSTLQQATINIQGGAATSISEMGSPGGINVDYYMNVLLDFGVPNNLIDYVLNLLGRIFDVVRASSVQIIIFIAALQSVSSSLYEVSKIEGATSYETFWKVTFPMVSPLILTNVVYTIVDSFANSEVIRMAYTTAFTTYDYGLSAAISLVCTLIVGLILIAVGTLITKFIFYHN